MHVDLITITSILMFLYFIILTAIGASMGDNIIGFCIIAALYAGFYQLYYRCLDASVYDIAATQENIRDNINRGRL